MGHFDYDAARMVFSELVNQYPDNPDLRTNLAISIFNRQAEGDEKTALALLAEVLNGDPDHVRARYCSGLLELHSGRPQKALEFFTLVLKKDPKDADLLYFIGKTLLQLSRYQEALDYFDRSLTQDAYLHSSYYGKIMALRQLERSEEAYAMIQEFQKLKSNPRARLAEFKYTRMGKKAEVWALNQSNPLPGPRPAGALFSGLKTLRGLEEIPWYPVSQTETVGNRRRRSERSLNPAISVCDVNGDGYPDIFISGAVKMGQDVGNALLWGNPGDGSFLPARGHPLARVADVNAALWGDLNQDGITDVYLCRKGPNQLWIQDGTGRWMEISIKTGTDNGNLDTVDGALLDADHDGDLDIFLVNANGSNELLNNNRDGTFRRLAAQYGLSGKSYTSRSLLINDLDGDRDADIIVFNRNTPHEVFINQRLWKYDAGSGFETFCKADITAACSGDVDSDGRIEIYTLDTAGLVHRWQPDQNGRWQDEPLTLAAPLDAAAGMALTDVDGDGILDLMVYGPNGWWSLAFNGSSLEVRHTEKQMKGLSAWGVINSFKGPHLMGWKPGAPPYLWSPGAGRFSFAKLKLTGMKDKNTTWRSNASGIGMNIAVRIGSRWTVLDTFRFRSGPGQDLQPAAVGMAGAQSIDFAAIDWSDGVFQSEMNLTTGKLHTIVETQRQMSSCPVIFAWNGEKYEFVSDFLGVGGIGYAIGPGEYSQPRPWENFMFPAAALKPKNQRLVIKLTEPMEEAAYIDAARLKAYLLPPGWHMTLDERMGINVPEPTGEPRFYRESVMPVQVINSRNQDVTITVTERDLKAAPPGPLDLRFIGLLEQDNQLTLKFEKPLDSRPGKPLLIAEGWLEYPYSQTNFAAWQAGKTYKAPTIEALDPNGQWVTILDQFGYPAGMPRQMSVALENLPAGTKSLRITTNQEIYWDWLAVAYVEECPAVTIEELKLETALLEHVGFPHRPYKGQRLPYYDYNQRRPFWDTRYIEGDYTRFGIVDELMTAKDNALVIFGAGEGIHLEYAVPTQPLPNNWTRVYVLETDGWCKDMDPYTHTGATVAPVPANGTPDFNVERLHKKYNIRFLSGRE